LTINARRFMDPRFNSRFFQPRCGLIAVLLLVLVGAFAGCETESVPVPDECVYAGTVYATGAQFAATDGCNTCECTSDGSVSCTLMACHSPCDWEGVTYQTGDTFSDGECGTCVCGADGNVSCDGNPCPVECEQDGITYIENQIVPTAEPCTECTCTANGVECIETPCNPCTHNEVQYWPGEIFPAGDGCNNCMCMESGEVACTDEDCSVVCAMKGVVYQPGDVFAADDGCNTCTCEDDGTISCTELDCTVEECTYAGVTYKKGATFAALDGCNQCICGSGGAFECTEVACPCDAENEWYRDYIGDSPEMCATIKFACPENTTYFGNACGCGCEQNLSCPQWFNCMPPAQCDPDEIKKTCPYSGIAW
jgi:hypothetical protein